MTYIKKHIKETIYIILEKNYLETQINVHIVVLIVQIHSITIWQKVITKNLPFVD